MLINLHADVDEVDDSKWTALHFAASRGHQNVLFLLLHGQASINAKTIDSQTALHLASKFGHGGCVKALLYFAEHVRVSINIDAQDHLGNTSLHYAAQWGFFDILDSLLEYKAQVDVMNRLKVTAKDLAHNSQITEALESAALQLEETPHGNNFVFISNEDLQVSFVFD